MVCFYGNISFLDFRLFCMLCETPMSNILALDGLGCYNLASETRFDLVGTLGLTCESLGRLLGSRLRRNSTLLLSFDFL